MSDLIKDLQAHLKSSKGTYAMRRDCGFAAAEIARLVDEISGLKILIDKEVLDLYYQRGNEAMKMNNESLNKWLAVEVMKWTAGETEYQWFDANGNRTLDGTLWNPTENIEQAFMCLDTFDDWDISREKSTGYWIDIHIMGENGKSDTIGGGDKSLARAISLISGHASGWKEV